MKLTIRPSFRTFKALVKKNPDLKVYKICPSLIKYLSRNTLEFAKYNKIRIVPYKCQAGRPYRYDKDMRRKLRNRNVSAKDVSEKLSVPLRTVYFYRA